MKPTPARKVGICGAQCSGKTTLTHQTVAALKKRNLVVGMCSDIARQSQYLIAGADTPEVQLELFGLQITAEVQLMRCNEIVLCDRTLLDRSIYAHMFYDDRLSPSQHALFAAMDQFTREYMTSYALLFRTTRLFDPHCTRDPLRPTELAFQQLFNSALERHIAELGLSCVELRGDEDVDVIATTICASLPELRD